ncbi:O-antigen ligase family protein [Paenibacillus sp. UMB4589-SE434]|uniref:O-antigen ligase family protein n=1 Tax=Paenibacillus sp. UMB4589-SE434 TaxID=3046314 RepID=UPI00254FCF7B|nr:O-antigen ligase family protein [Paenibacillus sp. UMB4589-SE434]MDK8183169.1 O-antigen ligase family protein [Paenibacillus sp. UMB4589-SE434]
MLKGTAHTSMHETRPFILWMIAAIVLGIGLYQQGLFYNHRMLPVAVLLIGIGVYHIIRKGIASALEDNVFPWPLWFPLAAAVCYGITLLLEPASVYGSWMQIIRWSSFGIWLMLIYGFLTCRQAIKKFHIVLVIIGIIMSFGSLCMLYGWLPYNGSVMSSSNDELSALGFRLGGWLQYPNTLGALAGAYALYHLGRLNELSPNKGIWMLESVCLLLHATVLGLTESRGAWLVTAGIVFVAWLVLKGTRLRFIGWAAWHGSWAILAVASTASLWLEQSQLIAIPLVLCLVGAAVIPYMLHVKSSNRTRRTHNGDRESFIQPWLAKVILAVVGTAVLGAALYVMPNEAGDRLTGHYETASARTLFYKDAWRLWQEYPWLGSGGDAWRQQFSSIQSEPYVGKEVHSSLFDMLLDIGAIGTLLTMGLAAVAIWQGWRRYQAAGMASAAIAAHSLIDFDMAYSWVIYVWLAWLALGYAGDKRWSEQVEADETQIQAELMQSDTKQVLRVKLRQRLAALALVVPLLVVAAAGLSHCVAQVLYATASGKHTAANAVTLRAAQRLAPADTALRIAAARSLPPREALALLMEGQRFERDGKALSRELALTAERSGNSQQAAAYWQAAVKADRFDRRLQTEAIVRLAAMAQAAAERGQTSLALTLAVDAERHFSAYDAEVRRIAAIEHVANGKRFAMTQEAERAAASVYLLTIPIK